MTALLSRFPPVILGQFIGEGLYIGLQRLRTFQSVCELLLKLNGGVQLLLDLRKLRFQGRELAALIETAAVQLLFQSVIGLCIRGILVAGGNEGRYAALQAGVLRDGQSTLADEGAALKDLPTDAQQSLAAIRPGQSLYRGGGAGVDSLEVRHRGGLPPGSPGDGEVGAVSVTFQPSGHGAAVPRGVAVFVGDETGLVPFAAVDAVEHGGQKGTPGGFSGFIGGFYDIKTILELQGLIPQPSEDGGHTLNQHSDTSAEHI